MKSTKKWSSITRGNHLQIIEVYITHRNTISIIKYTSNYYSVITNVQKITDQSSALTP